MVRHFWLDCNHQVLPVSKELLIDLETLTPYLQDTNQQPKEGREEKEGSVNVRDFLSRLSSKPLLDEQKQKSEPFDYEDDEVEFTVCHGTGIEGIIRLQNEGRTGVVYTRQKTLTLQSAKVKGSFMGLRP